MKRISANSKVGLIGLALLSCVCLGNDWLTQPTSARQAGVSLSGTGTATIDGVLSPGEWAGAASATVYINLPALEGGGTAVATLYVMSDTANLYFALKAPRPSMDTSSFVMEFDNDNDGVREDGDDAFVLNTSPYGPPTLFDDYRYTCSYGLAACSAFDDADGGTVDGLGAATNSGGFTIYEVSRPLNNSDDAHDFSLNSGDRIGFVLYYRVITGGFPEGFGDTTFPLGTLGEIVIGNTTLPVTIDIKPGAFPNTIRPGTPGRVTVAILTTPAFNAVDEVNPNSIRFGANGMNAAALLGQWNTVDVDMDGDLDWTFQFTISSTGITCGMTTAKLTGKTRSNVRIEGADSIRTAGC